MKEKRHPSRLYFSTDFRFYRLVLLVSFWWGLTTWFAVGTMRGYISYEYIHFLFLPYHLPWAKKTRVQKLDDSSSWKTKFRRYIYLSFCIFVVVLQNESKNSGRNPDKFTSTRVTENKIEFNWKSLSPIFLFLVLQNHDKNTKRKTNIPPKFRFSARTIVQFRDFNFFHSSCERELKSSCLSLWKISSNF